MMVMKGLNCPTAALLNNNIGDDNYYVYDMGNNEIMKKQSLSWDDNVYAAIKFTCSTLFLCYFVQLIFFV